MPTKVRHLSKLPAADICSRAGVFDPKKYIALVSDGSLVGVGIDPGAYVYVLTTTEVESGDLAAIETPDGLLLGFVHFYFNWLADPMEGLFVRLESAHPEVAPRLYEYDSSTLRVRGRATWVCKQGDHSQCFAYVRGWRGALDALPIKRRPKRETKLTILNFSGEKRTRSKV